jgi:hypothetical protein
MKKSFFLLSAIFMLVATSCTNDELPSQDKKATNAINKNDQQASAEEGVDPGTVKPPTHG